jgi:hypothetical protein
MTDPDPVIARALRAADLLRGHPVNPETINAAFRALDDTELRTAEHTDGDAPASPPKPYEGGLNQLRAAAAPLSTFESGYREARLRDLEAMRTKLDAEEPTPHLTTAEELASYAPPDPYAAAIKALRERKRR